MIYMVFQEAFMTKAKQESTSDLSGIGWFVTFIQFFIYSIFMALLRLYETSVNDSPATVADTTATHHLTTPAPPTLTPPVYKFAILGVLSVGTMGLSNVAAFHLSIPVLQVFKSAKILPVMLLGKCVLGKTYSHMHYLAVVLISAGLIIFVVTDATDRPTVNVAGLLLVCGSLASDALIGNWQEKLFTDYPTLSISESMLKSKFFGCLAALVVCVTTNNFVTSITFCWAYFSTVSVWIISFAMVGVVGENFIMVLVKQFGAVVTVTTTTVRKGLSLVLSFVLFPKVFRWGYLIGGMVMVAGIVLNVLVKNPKAKQVWARKCGAGGGRERKQQSLLPLVV